MANSSIIGDLKSEIIKEFLKDDDLLKAIGSGSLSLKNRGEYVGKHIFNYNQNPETLTKVETFITIQTHINDVFKGRDVFVKPVIEILIVSHERHMKLEAEFGVNMNRNDYISELIDNKLNGKSKFNKKMLGFGGFVLKINSEGTLQKNYLYRKMIFEGMDLNDSLCDDE